METYMRLKTDTSSCQAFSMISCGTQEADAALGMDEEQQLQMALLNDLVENTFYHEQNHGLVEVKQESEDEEEFVAVKDEYDIDPPELDGDFNAAKAWENDEENQDDAETTSPVDDTAIQNGLQDLACPSEEPPVQDDGYDAPTKELPERSRSPSRKPTRRSRSPSRKPTRRSRTRTRRRRSSTSSSRTRSTKRKMKKLLDDINFKFLSFTTGKDCVMFLVCFSYMRSAQAHCCSSDCHQKKEKTLQFQLIQQIRCGHKKSAC